jgi:integrase/recombinase XerD
MSSVLGPVIACYLGLKKALGRQCETESAILQSLDSLLQNHLLASSGLSEEAFANWCVTLTRLTPNVRRNWMRIARNLCLYRQRTDPGCFVPNIAADIGGGLDGMPRQSRIFSMASGGCMAQRILILPPQ